MEEVSQPGKVIHRLNILMDEEEEIEDDMVPISIQGEQP